MQLYAGAISEGIFEILEDVSSPGFDAQRAVEMLSVFNLELTDVEQNPSPPSWCAVLDNILSRGTPTLASPFVEGVLEERLGLTRKADSHIGDISFHLNVDESDRMGFNQQLRRALYPVEPRLDPCEAWWKEVPCDEELAKKLLPNLREKEFATSFLPNQLGNEYGFLFQLLEPQRLLDSIVGGGFVDQRCDFALELPNKDGKYIFEIDGPDHDIQPKLGHDQARDSNASAKGWTTIGVRNAEVIMESFDDTLIPDRINRHRYDFDREVELRKIRQKKPIKIAKASFADPCWKEKEEFAAKVFQLVLVPIAVARIQKTLIQLVRHGVLSLDAPKWKIAIHERDVPCAWLAVEDFLRLLENYLILKGSEFLPEVEVRAYVSQEFANAKMACPPSDLSFTFRHEVAGFRGERLDQVKSFDADVFLDIAVLHRTSLTKVEPVFKRRVALNAPTVLIRSVYSIQEEFQLQAAEPFAYPVDENTEFPPLFEEDEFPHILFHFALYTDQHGEVNLSIILLTLYLYRVLVLRYFLQLIFRKESFREGQVRILKRALARQSVIGLLPTGAGKSICYQLVGMLQ
ncbi:hypothetical protein IH992_21230, partial [Candidatus Poribacteria bacterium]|nr:hypothetical protein [Candidatus Poribacteria bacterium]